MNQGELRYGIISALLQADTPLAFPELVLRYEGTAEQVLPVLKTLVNENLVVEGRLLPNYSLDTVHARDGDIITANRPAVANALAEEKKGFHREI